MNQEVQVLEQRRTVLQGYVQRRLKEGFSIISRCETSAELFRPAGFPVFLRKPQSLYVQVDEQGRVWVNKSNY